MKTFSSNHNKIWIPSPPVRRPRLPWSACGFTILELMVSIMIFSLVLAAIYSTWLSILKGFKISLDAAAEVQRSRIAIRTLEDAFVTSVMYTANIKHYAFIADTSGDMASVSMVSRLPASFPGVGRYPAIVRRVEFVVEPGPQGNRLIMRQAPMLQDCERNAPYQLTLAKDVTLFRLEFWDDQKGEWLEEWMNTNQMPRMVKIALGLGQSKNFASDPRDLVTTLVAIPSMAVPGDIQGAMGPGGRLPGIPGTVPVTGGNLPPGSTFTPGFPGGGRPFRPIPRRSGSRGDR